MSTSPNPDSRPETATPQLRLFQPTSLSGLSPSMTLSEFYWAFVRTNCLKAHGAKKTNLAEYDTSIKYWAELTGDPPLSSIDDGFTGGFLCALRELPGKKKGSKMAKTTIHKHCRHLQYMFDRAGPRSRDNRLGQGLIAITPYLDRPKIGRQTVTKNFSLVEIAALLDACADLVWPSLGWVPAPAWWRSLILVGYNTGLRIGTLVELRFSWLRTDELGTWVEVPGWALKTDDARRFYINPWALSALGTVRPPAGSSEDRVYAWQHGNSWLHGVRRRLFKRAGLPAARAEGNGFHGLRKAFVTELSKINAVAAKMAAGHSPDVTIDFYTAECVMVEAMNKLPQPAWPKAA